MGSKVAPPVASVLMVALCIVDLGGNCLPFLGMIAQAPN